MLKLGSIVPAGLALSDDATKQEKRNCQIAFTEAHNLFTFARFAIAFLIFVPVPRSRVFIPDLEIRETPVHVLLGKQTKVWSRRRLDFKRRNGDKLPPQYYAEKSACQEEA
jgi:hypothetical protein